jgi:hypothetical protein
MASGRWALPPWHSLGARLKNRSDSFMFTWAHDTPHAPRPYRKMADTVASNRFIRCFKFPSPTVLSITLSLPRATRPLANVILSWSFLLPSCWKSSPRVGIRMGPNCSGDVWEQLGPIQNESSQ